MSLVGWKEDFNMSFMTNVPSQLEGVKYLENIADKYKDVVNENDTITIEGTDFDEITWVSNCNVILRESDITSGKATLDLHSDLLEEPYLYVRFYITGENGICYSQPFVLNVEGEEFEPVEVERTVYDLPWFLRKLVTVVDLAFFRANPIIWIFKYFALGYNPVSFERLFNPF